MNNITKQLLLALSFVGIISGCASENKIPLITYAQNPFNPFPASIKKKPSPISPATLIGASDIALNAASTSIPGALSPGAGAGLSSGVFLLKGLSHIRIPVQTAENTNYIFMHMPISEAAKEDEAEKKAKKIVANAAISALLPDYQAKLESYEDTLNGKKWLREWYLVKGPGCENWSCQLIPMLQQCPLNFFQETYVVQSKFNSKETYSFGDIHQAISLVKITNDYIETNGSDAYRIVEGEEIPGFDYENYIRKISAISPSWLSFGFQSKKNK
jgi:hypothetical protein